MGGSLFAVYPVEAPGGYMLVALTLEAWDTYGTKPNFTPTRPWLYEPFDIINYHEVSIAEYDQLMRDYKSGTYHFDIRESVFDLKEVYDMFEAAKTDPEVIAFKERQKKGVAEQLAIEQKLYAEWTSEQEVQKEREAERLKGILSSEPAITIDSPMDANVWKLMVEPGDLLREGQVVAILEAMKMEINIICTAEAVGAKVEAIASKPGTVVSPGAWLIVAKKDKA